MKTIKKNSIILISLIRRHYPIIIAIGIFCATLIGCLVFSVRQNQEHLIYALDDPYIHMAIAKNFAQHGIWGITRFEFSSSSSSLLWVILLSLVYFLFGINELAPFILNVVFAVAIFVLSYMLFRRYRIRSFIIFVGLTAMMFLTSLFSLIFCGQEHTLHLLITIAFVYLSAEIISKEKINNQEYSLLLILSPLLTMSRYEGIFLLFVVSFLFIVKKKLLHALFLGGFGFLPIVIFGLLSVSKGWYFLPNSVLLKGNMPNISSLRSIFMFFFAAPYIKFIKLPTYYFLLFRL